MPVKNLKKHIDSVNKRKTRRSLVLHAKKSSKEQAGFKISIIKNRKRAKAVNSIFIDFPKLIKKYTVFSLVKNSLVKITVIALILGLNWSAISAISGTRAYFSDTETLGNNMFSAGLLDIGTDLDGLEIVSLDTENNYIISNQGSLPFRYSIETEISGGSDVVFCNQLNIEVLIGAEALYAGNLPGLNFNKLVGPTEDDLTFTITDPNNYLLGKVCSFDFVSKAWQDDFEYGQGFTDIARTKAVVYSAGTIIPPVSNGVVLNEFLPRPNGIEYNFDFGNNSSDMPQGEWVELYNNADTDADVTGWYLADSSSGSGNETPINGNHILVSSPVVPAHGWLVVYMNKAIYNNPGDTVRLFNADGVLVDSYSYGIAPTYCDMEPTSSDDNTANPSGICNSSNVPGNKSFARIPDGIGAWIDPIPTPGKTNVVPEDLDLGTLSIENPPVADSSASVENPTDTEQDTEEPVDSGDILGNTDLNTDGDITDANDIIETTMENTENIIDGDTSEDAADTIPNTDTNNDIDTDIDADIDVDADTVTEIADIIAEDVASEPANSIITENSENASLVEDVVPADILSDMENSGDTSIDDSAPETENITADAAPEDTPTTTAEASAPVETSSL